MRVGKALAFAYRMQHAQWRTTEESCLQGVCIQYAPDEKTKILLYPCSVDRSAAPELTFLQNDLLAPLLLVDGVDISARFDAKTTSRPTRREAFLRRRSLNFAACVELESGLGAECFKVDLGVGVAELDELLHWFLARIKWYARRIRIYDEAVIWVGL